MIRTYDVTLWTRIPGQIPAKYKLRMFRAFAESPAAAVEAAINKARVHYITASHPFFDAREVRTLKVRIVDGLEHFVFLNLPAVWRYLKPTRSEIVSGDVTGLRLRLARLVGGVGPGVRS